MTLIDIYLNKSVDENASLYYEKAKKAKKKIEGIKKAISNSEELLKKQEMKNQSERVNAEKKDSKKIIRKSAWYEKFRWFYTSSGKLVIGGRDSSSNEIVIKKHTDKDDLVFHTDMAGSPFMVIKAEGNEISKQDIDETAEFLACYSKAWKAGISSIEVFYVKPDQVTKEANAGEYLQKGSFMIRGKTTYVHASLRLAITVSDNQVFAGPISSIKKFISSKNPDLNKSEISKKYVKILQGTLKSSQIAKDIKKILGGDIDELIKVIPPGGCKISK